MKNALERLLRKGINQMIDLDRRNVLNEMFTHYSRTSDLLFCRVKFRYTGDDEGHRKSEEIFKEVFTTFWREIFETGFHGERMKVPNKSSNDVRGPEALQWQAIGRILSHFMLLFGYLPVKFCRSALYHILNQESNVPDEVLLNDFLAFVTEQESCLLHKYLCINAELPMTDENALERLFHHYDFPSNLLESLAERKKQLVRIARNELITKPSYFYGLVRDGIPNEYKEALWKQVTLSHLTLIYKKLMPTPNKVANQLRIVTTDGKIVALNNELNFLSQEQSNAIYYLRQAVSGFNAEVLAKFLQLLTGTDLMVNSHIHVIFKDYRKNYLKFYKRDCSLELTATYTSQQEFNNDILTQLRNSYELED